MPEALKSSPLSIETWFAILSIALGVGLAVTTRLSRDIASSCACACRALKRILANPSASPEEFM
jgi:hypothetical protein|tara:strand:+ start:1414 stop:1605 length:192 start_codon:yes stop_codon:yes gene_type:complete